MLPVNYVIDYVFLSFIRPYMNSSNSCITVYPIHTRHAGLLCHYCERLRLQLRLVKTGWREVGPTGISNQTFYVSLLLLVTFLTEELIPSLTLIVWWHIIPKMGHLVSKCNRLTADTENKSEIKMYAIFSQQLLFLYNIILSRSQVVIEIVSTWSQRIGIVRVSYRWQEIGLG